MASRIPVLQHVPREDIEFVFRIFSRLRKLRVNGSRVGRVVKILASDDPPSYHTLQDIKLGSCIPTGVSPHEISRLLSISSLRVLDLCECPDLDGVVPADDIPPLNLTSLSIRPNAVSQAAFEFILARCSKLEQVQYTTLFPTTPDCMTRLSHALCPLSSTLKRLSVSFNGSPFDYQDSSRLDLSALKALTWLEASSICLFEYTSSDPGPAFYTYLPRSLVSLTIVWCILHPPIIFPSNSEQLRIQEYTHTRANPRAKASFHEANDHAWLLDLAHHKAAYVPALKEICLVGIT
ncbi:hypothetical protein BDV95DRAFT_562367 [Massariosphaeria phaeospora]|uniref:F-box domain-containing protein n=1 Tax=Massariosphaeria phaeospora TaxID=100035 RepID=A0A7C8ILE1_9PLEO|nr:hypothetical protein BDV95DRAFT_562367 [Massariosphaeria phaeospora]